MTTEYRDERYIRELEREIESNECGASDCLWCFCCGIFGLICIIPKYNKRKLANERLVAELQKPRYTSPQAAPQYSPPGGEKAAQ